MSTPTKRKSSSSSSIPSVILKDHEKGIKPSVLEPPYLHGLEPAPTKSVVCRKGNQLAAAPPQATKSADKITKKNTKNATVAAAVGTAPQAVTGDQLKSVLSALMQCTIGGKKLEDAERRRLIESLPPCEWKEPYGRICYRVLRDDEDPAKGLFAKDPTKTMKLDYHCSGTRAASPWISMSYDPQWILFYALGQDKSPLIVKIDVMQTLGNVYDPRHHVKETNKMAVPNIANASEIVIEGFIPPTAIRAVFKFDYADPKVKFCREIALAAQKKTSGRYRYFRDQLAATKGYASKGQRQMWRAAKCKEEV